MFRCHNIVTLADLLYLESDGASTSVNTIKDMLAGLPEFSEKKEAFSLHLDMAEKCMKIFQENKLLDLGSVEQVGVSDAQMRIS